jgi:hypothetical protein
VVATSGLVVFVIVWCRLRRICRCSFVLFCVLVVKFFPVVILCLSAFCCEE